MRHTQQTLSLPRTLINKIMTHAQKNPDVEVCGLIGNSNSGKKEYYSIKNASNKPSCQFLMDTSEQIHAMKEMRKKQQTLFSIVHSHPSANATPSQLDIKENEYKEVFYLIISLNTKGVLEIRAFTQDKSNMSEIDLLLES